MSGLRDGLAGRAIKANARRAGLPEVEKIFNSEYGELYDVYRTELTLRLRMYQKIAFFFNISAHRCAFSRSHGPV